MNPKFSIITVCYNSEKTLKTTMESVLNQTLQDFEYIIIDGKSTDGTIALVQQYEPKFKGRLRWISEADNGIYDAMNKGIALASGELIGIINSDDWYERDALSKVNQAYTGNEALLHGKMTMMKDENTVEVACFNKLNYSLIKRACILYHPTCFVPQHVYNEIGAYNAEYRISADYDFFYRLINRGLPICFIDSEIACMRAGGASAKSVRLNLKENYRIRISNGLGPFEALYFTFLEYARHLALKVKKIS